jgi:hypothetical protein
MKFDVYINDIYMNSFNIPSKDAVTISGITLYSMEWCYDKRLQYTGYFDNVIVEGTYSDSINSPPTTHCELTGIPGDNSWWISDVVATLSATDDSSGVASTGYTTDGATWLAYTDPITFTEGINTLQYRSTDGEGTVEPVQSEAINIDTTAPVTILSVEGVPGEDEWFVSEVLVTLDATDNLSGINRIEYRINGDPWITYEGPFRLAEGVHQIEYRSIDNAGNVEVTDYTPVVGESTTTIEYVVVTIQVDQSSSATHVSVAPSSDSSTGGSTGGSSSGTTVTYPHPDIGTPSSGDSVVKIYYYVPSGSSGGDWVDYTEPVSFTEEGSYTVEYKIEYEDAPAEYKTVTIYVDWTPPETTISLNGVQNEGVWINGVEISFVATDAVSGVARTEYSIDGEAWLECTTPFSLGDGAYEIRYHSVDVAGNVEDEKVAIFTVQANQPPQIDPIGDKFVNEGETLTFPVSASDPDGEALTIVASNLPEGASFDSATNVFSWTPDFTMDGDYSEITFEVTDGLGESDSEQINITVVNVNRLPVIEAIVVLPETPIQVGSEISASITFSDPDTDDTWVLNYDWGDGSEQPTEMSVSTQGSFSGSHQYSAPGVYTLLVTVIDDDGDSDTAEYQYVVVYDPDGGFVTGGGWIDSPEGAYAPDTTLSGKATFGFVSKYKKGATVPEGQTQFQFKVADLSFHSDSYQWLVIAGPKAQYKGSGTINGEGDYGFMLTALDAELTPSSVVDKFRIKIWDKLSGDIIYDNQPDDADDVELSTEIGGGSVVIHNK